VGRKHRGDGALAETANDFAPLRDVPRRDIVVPLWERRLQTETMMQIFKFSFTEEGAITERRPTIRTCSIGESSTIAYAAIRSALLERGSSRRIDSLAVTNPAYISVSIVAKTGLGLRSSMGEAHVTKLQRMRTFWEKGGIGVVRT